MSKPYFRESTLSTIFIWLGLFALLPILVLLLISFTVSTQSTIFSWQFTLDNFIQLFQPIYATIFWHSLVFSVLCSALTLALGYPAAYCLSRVGRRYQSLLFLLMVIPFWTSSLIRTYAMMALVKTKGLINSFLLSLGIIHKPLLMLYTNEAVLIAMAYNLLPYMILPLYSNFEKLDYRLLDAAKDLGARRWRIFHSVILPLTLPGIIVGVLFVFLPAMTIFYVPDLLGGAHSVLVGNLVKTQFVTMNDWPGGSATSMVLTAILLLLIFCYRRRIRSRQLQEFL